jgi:hypothetical protein
MNTWILRGETPEGFEFLNAIRDHNPLILDHNQIRHFDAPDKLVLRGQVIFKDTSVFYEPFHPRPASPSIPNTSLRLSLENTPDSGLIELPGPTTDNFRFWVTNSGKQTVRDYRVIILVPPAFLAPNYGSYLGTLTKQHETMIGGQRHTAFEQSMLKPIYQNDSIKIGEILFSTTLGDHIILWQIRCDDGVFPLEAQYGEIKVRIVPSRQ